MKQTPSGEKAPDFVMERTKSVVAKKGCRVPRRDREMRRKRGGLNTIPSRLDAGKLRYNLMIKSELDTV